MFNNTLLITDDIDDRSLTALLLVDLPLAYIKLSGMLIVFLLILPVSFLNYQIFKLRRIYMKYRRPRMTRQ
ncbi:MAG: hypothetical protein K2K72_03230 [Duncaniella sp.]|nr:hypothetical protein [Duncaniella sp.]